MQETSLEYRQSLAEINFILHHTDDIYIQKIPLKFRKFLLDNEDKNYKIEFDVSKDFSEWNLKPKTKSLLALIYIDYLCTPEQKEVYRRNLANNEQEKQKELIEKYNPDDIFKKYIIEENTVKDEVSLSEYKESIFKKFINKIKNVFHIS